MKHATNGRITLAILGTKMDEHTKAIEALTEELKTHIKESHRLDIEVDRLMQIEANRKWHIRALWGALITSIVTWIIKRIMYV